MLVRGRRAPIVGSVCMDMSMVDVTGTDVAPGDEVVIVGEQGEESIGVREIAAAIGTIPYELLCRVGTRIQGSIEVDGTRHSQLGDERGIASGCQSAFSVPRRPTPARSRARAAALACRSSSMGGRSLPQSPDDRSKLELSARSWRAWRLEAHGDK